MILVTSYWRGSMHVDALRVFSDDQEQEARDYHRDISAHEDTRVYRVYPDKEPERLKW